MPVTIDYNKTALESIDILKARLENGQLDYENYAQDAKEIYAAIFALRQTVGSVRKKKASLEVQPNQEAYEKNYQALMEDPSFAAFVTEQGTQKMNRMIAAGHGGEAEDAFRQQILEEPRLNKKLSQRYMPTAKARINKLQEQLWNVQPKSEEAARIYAEIFRARRAVRAIHKQEPERLDATINPSAFDKTPDLEHSYLFKEFIRQEGEELKRTIRKETGGEAEHMFKNFLMKRDHIPEDAPAAYVPTAEERITALQEKIGADDFDHLPEKNKLALLTELFAARSCVGAVRGKKESLNYRMDPKNLNDWNKYLSKSETFQNFLKSDLASAKKAALKGHGGAMEDKLKEYCKTRDHLPDDIPNKYMPTALERIDHLKEKITSDAFHDLPKKKQAELMTELMAARSAVNAKRKDVDSLKVGIDTVKGSAAIEKWTKCEAFQTYISHYSMEAVKAVKEGHGGALEDKFKEYIKDLDQIPKGTPAEFMPTAEERTKTLQDKIKKTNDRDRLSKLYKELMATRSAVDSVRGDAESLKKGIDAEKLEAARTQLDKSRSFGRFLQLSGTAELKKKAGAGHGGALDDHYRDYVKKRSVELGWTPSGVAERFRFSPKEILADQKKAMKKELDTHNEVWCAANKEEIKKQVASVMYLSQADVKKPSQKDKLSAMSHDQMKEGVQKIMDDRRFKAMFETLGPREALKKASAKNISPLFEAYHEARVFENPNPQPANQNPQHANQNPQQGNQNPQHANQNPQQGNQNPRPQQGLNI